MPVEAALTDWLTAIGGVGAFVATGVLAFLAWRQMAKLAEQGRTLASQAESMKEQVDVMRRAAADDLAAVEAHVAASVEQGNAIRDAARAQLQPVVLAHDLGHYFGPNDELSIGSEQVAFTYYLANEGSGLALNIRHGVEISGVVHEHSMTRVLGPGESAEIRDPSPEAASITGIRHGVNRLASDLPDDWLSRIYYWVRFENVFGEQFETRTPNTPGRPADFRRVS